MAAVLHRIARTAIRSPRRILAVAALLTALTAIFRIPVANHLPAGRFQVSFSESARAGRPLTEQFGQGDQPFLISVTHLTGAYSLRSR